MKMAGIRLNKWRPGLRRAQPYKTANCKIQDVSIKVVSTVCINPPPTVNSKHRRTARRTAWPSAKILPRQGRMAGNQRQRNRTIGNWRVTSAQQCHFKARCYMKMWKLLGIIYRLPPRIIISNINPTKSRDHIIINPRSHIREARQMTSRPSALTLADLSIMGEILRI